MMRKTFLTSALDMPEIMSYIYNKSWKLQFSASSSIIIIEDFYLQTFLHSLGCSVNELPLSFVLSWYEQKAVCILLTLLHLGIKNIRLGPSLPAFLSPNILNFLVENYGIAPITTPEEDIKALLNHSK